MTDTITADPGHGTDSQDGPVASTIEHLDPHNLVPRVGSDFTV
jgi:hypothetical protein